MSLRVLVQFDPNGIDKLILNKWRDEGRIKWSRKREEMLYLPEEKGEEEFPLPPELDGQPLMVCITAEETDCVVVCSRDGSRRKPYRPSVGCCSDEISGTFMAAKHLVTLEVEGAIFNLRTCIDWHFAIPVRLGNTTSVQITDKPIWEGEAGSYLPKFTPGADFRAAIAALRERVLCAGGKDCVGPHYADLSEINDPAKLIAENHGKKFATKVAVGK